MNHETTSSVREHILKNIEEGKLRMRPRLFFLGKLIATCAAAALVLLLSSLAASFILFSLEEGGEEFLLGFGFRGLLMFLALFPWSLFVLDIGAILLLRLLLKGLWPVYRSSFATVLGVLVSVSVVLALLINLTPLHSMLLERAVTDDLPFVDFLYEDIRAPDEAHGEFRGVIESIEVRTFTITHDDYDDDGDDGTRVIIIPESIDISEFQVGDEIYVAGDDDDDDDVIDAYGARELHGVQEDEGEDD